MQPPYVIENTDDESVGDPGFLPKIARGLRRAGHMLGLIPFVNGFGAMLVGIGSAAEVSDSLFAGKIFKAVKQAVMGTVDFVITGLSGSAIAGMANAAGATNLMTSVAPGLIAWAADPIALIATGKTAGELGRSATGALLDAPEEMAKRNQQKQYRQSVMAMQQQYGNVATRGYAPAAVGWAPGMEQGMDMTAANDRHWFNMEAQRRGVEPDAAYRNYSNGNSEHVAALEDARERGPQQQQL